MLRELPHTGTFRSVLELDPDLADGIAADDLPRLSRLLIGRVLALPAGGWEIEPDPESLGFLIVDGLVCRQVSLGDRRSLELLGSGDIVQPPPAAGWPQLGDGTALTAISDTVVLELGAEFLRGAASCPRVLAAIGQRIDAQRERLATQGLIAHMPRAQHRLLLALWHLAGRWGRVTSEGTVIPLQLTHSLIGQLIAARRSTATLAISHGERDGWLKRRADGSWMLTGEAERRAMALARTQAARSDAVSLMVRQRTAAHS